MKTMTVAASMALLLTLTSCDTPQTMQPTPPASDAQNLLDKYTTVRLTTSLAALSEKEKQMIPLLLEAADIMNSIFWTEAYGKQDSLMTVLSDPALKRFVEINYGPWDRLDSNRPFIEGVGPKPAGANFYPADMAKEEFERAAAENPDLRSLYTMVRRDDAGKLVAIPYHTFFSEAVQAAAQKLRQAAALAEDPGLRRYLELRAGALLNDNYQASDLAWMDMKDNTLDVVIGPIESYEDQLFGYKTAHEAFILVKDHDWSRRLARYAQLLPMLQQGLPVPDAYKQESPGSDSDLNAYDAVYYAGDANAGSKTIAINLPNDEEVQLQKGTRRLQLKNSMRAKFDEILMPISEALIAPDQRAHVTFDAFFANTMFHEVAHGLGIKNLVNSSGTVREALRDHASSMEEGKADVLGLYMVGALKEAGELDVDLLDHYATFLAGIFRSIRFGGASAHGRANLVRFNYFKERGAFTRDEATGAYRVDLEKMQQAVDALSEQLLRLQGDGDYDAVAAFVAQYGDMDAQLNESLAHLEEKGIPVDVVFEQGLSVLDLPGSNAAPEGTR